MNQSLGNFAVCELENSLFLNGNESKLQWAMVFQVPSSHSLGVIAGPKLERADGVRPMGTWHRNELVKTIRGGVGNEKNVNNQQLHDLHVYVYDFFMTAYQ